MCHWVGSVLSGEGPSLSFLPNSQQLQSCWAATAEQLLHFAGPVLLQLLAIQPRACLGGGVEEKDREKKRDEKKFKDIDLPR